MQAYCAASAAQHSTKNTCRMAMPGSSIRSWQPSVQSAQQTDHTNERTVADSRCCQQTTSSNMLPWAVRKAVISHTAVLEKHHNTPLKNQRYQRQHLANIQTNSRLARRRTQNMPQALPQCANCNPNNSGQATSQKPLACNINSNNSDNTHPAHLPRTPRHKHTHRAAATLKFA